MVKAYILTVDTDGGQRITQSERQIHGVGIPWQFVNGLILTNNNVVDYSTFRNFLFYRRNMIPAEIAVYLGHRRVWEHFIADEVEYALVLEDDFQIIDLENLRTAIKDAIAHPSSWDIIKFFDVWSKRPVAAMDLGSTRFVCRKYPPNGAVAYLLKASAARALLSRKRIYRPVDEDISRPWEFSLRVWSSERNLVTENAKALGGSLLDAERSGEEHARRKNPIRYIFIRNLLELSKLIRSKRYQRRIRENPICTPV